MDPQTLAKILTAQAQPQDDVTFSLDQPGTFLPWVYNDQPTPQEQLRIEDNPAIATARKLGNIQMWMEQNLADPRRWFAVPDANGRAGSFGVPLGGWGI